DWVTDLESGVECHVAVKAEGELAIEKNVHAVLALLLRLDGGDRAASWSRGKIGHRLFFSISIDLATFSTVRVPASARRLCTWGTPLEGTPGRCCSGRRRSRRC